MSSYNVVCADVVEWAESYEGPPFMALLTDAPYEMSFMSKSWDASGVSADPQTWKALAAHLLPGAFLFVFAGTRNDDLISLALRKAGLRKHHKALAWITGQGFPKSTRINRSGIGHDEWEGHRYGGQVLKPSVESILIFQKPYAGKPVDCITRTGAGALNIDGGRIGSPPRSVPQPEFNSPTGQIYGFKSGEGRSGKMSQGSQGRWPANFCLVHAPGCQRTGTRKVKGDKRDGSITNTPARSWKNQSKMGIARQGHADSDGLETVTVWDCVPECAVRKLGEQSGERPSGGQVRGNEPSASTTKRVYEGGYKKRSSVSRKDRGTAARFFHNADWQHEIVEQLAAADPVFYQAKASRKERDAGLDEHFQEKMLRWSSGNQSPGTFQSDGTNKYARNFHPTVKPIGLALWLCRLLTPPVEYAPRRLLIPFAGSGSEMCAAILSGGFEEIIGIEMNAEYVRISEARLAHWAATMREPRQMGLPDPPRCESKGDEIK